MKNKPHATTDLCIELLSKFAKDFYTLTNSENLPATLSYTIKHREESGSVERSARKAALRGLITKPSTATLVKFALDTRRIDQENDRIPRSNLQYWHRTDEFISDEQQKKINSFSRLFSVLGGLREIYGASPDWHNSYSRVLYDSVDRALRISQADQDITDSQLSYLEQLLDARYRLRMTDLDSTSDHDLKNIILKKDETMVRRGEYPIQMNKIDKHSQVQDLIAKISQTPYQNTPQIIQAAPVIPEIHNHIQVDGNRSDSGINALLAGSGIVRKEGERTIERTITIKIRDEVLD